MQLLRRHCFFALWLALLCAAGYAAPAVGVAVVEDPGQGGAGTMIAQWVAVISPVLFGLAVLLIIVEFATSGFGVFGVAGLALLALCFWAQHAAGMAGMTEALLILAAKVLLALEIFVVPGFGVTGISGIVCLVAGLAMCFLPPLSGMDAHDLLPLLPGALTRLFITLAMILVGVLLILRCLPHVPLLNGLVLTRSLAEGTGATAKQSEERASLVGKNGEALTDLRPAGTALIDGRRVDVLTTGAYVRRGTAVTVVDENGTAIFVEPRGGDGLF